MILDKMAELTTATGFDLEAKHPGPGKPIKMYAIGVGGSLAVTMGADQATAEGGLTPCITVDATNTVFFDLPSNTLRWIAATFATGEVGVLMDGQTNL